MLTIDESQTAAFDVCLTAIQETSPRWSTYTDACYLLCLHAQKDISWVQALRTEGAPEAIAALEAEFASLESTILTRVEPGHPDFEEALALATPGRVLLDIRRKGTYKARGVKQGFKEDRILADGPDFNYYAHVAKFVSVRTSLFRPNRGTRRVALKDVSTAFLQADAYADDVRKYVCFKWPTTGQWHYFKQSGPIYGEPSAVIRWENTIAPWFESVDFVRGENEPCCYNHAERDLLALLYVDDTMLDAEEDDIRWMSDAMDARFKCKETEWLSHDEPLDLLGMMLSEDENAVYLSMYTYIMNTVQMLEWDTLKPVSTPMNSEIDSESPKLSAPLTRKFMTAVGCLGWLVNTGRPDVAHTHSRIAQHMANPTESALEAVKRCFAYLKGTADLGLASMRSSDLDAKEYHWEFYCDSDFAGNCEVQNRRRSQNGYIALLNGAPVLWGSKVSSVAFVHPPIGEAHPDVSSGAAEVYAAANATFEFLHLSYVVDELGIDFPVPFTLQTLPSRLQTELPSN